MLAAAPFLLHALHTAGTSQVRSTLAILAICYVPILCIGIWSGICTAQGRNLVAMGVGGLPYLVMTLTLFALYVFGRLNNLSLPISMTAGFGLIGLLSLVCILRSEPFSASAASLVHVWRLPEFRAFLRQLGASSIENGGFAANQLLMLYFLSRVGTGAVSANNCAMRIGLLGFTLLASPLALLVQARLCAAEDKERPALFRRWMLVVGGGVLLLALTLLVFRFPVIRIIYMHGKFQGSELQQVAELLPAWLGYLIVMSANAIVARYLFIREQGGMYVRRQLAAYGVANLARIMVAGSAGPASIVWCSVVPEAFVVVLNLRACAAGAGTPREMVPALATGSEVL
jgi:peptidoglycan biosynthesis protein MviN/MurJ (putative lipid II flippase)